MCSLENSFNFALCLKAFIIKCWGWGREKEERNWRQDVNSFSEEFLCKGSRIKRNLLSSRSQNWEK